MMQFRLFLSFVALALMPVGLFAQTVQAPDLQCVQNDNANGNITLTWTNPTNSCGPFVSYIIYGATTQAGPYTQIATVTTQSQTTYVHTNALATSTTWFYYMQSDFNCPGATVLQSDTVNNSNPLTPEIVNVDVTPGGDVVFNWLPGASPQTHFYIIYYYLPNGFAEPLDTVYGINTVTYTDVIGDPTTQSLVYTVAAADSCGSISAFNTLPHNTIYATAALVQCQNQVNVAWNRYINWAAGVKEYQIWVDRNNTGFQQVASTDTSTLVYNYSGFNDGDSLCLFIRAVNAGDTNLVSNSNMICMRASIVQPPSFIFITNVTVDQDNHNVVTWTVDTMAALLFYKIDRSTNGVTYESIDQIPVPTPLNLFETVVDSNVTPEGNPYYYQVTAFNSCQHNYTTPYGKTICLKGELFDYYVANVNWNDFELEHATVLRYKLYRNYGTGFQLIKTFQPGTNAYSDSLQQFLQEQGIFCYRIEAEYYLNLPHGYSDTLSSFSNELCIIHRPIIYIPNAFAPNGVNSVFKPTIIYGNPKGYTMTIFNRWGGKVFESSDVNTGWDGLDNFNKDAPAGGYAYLISFYAEDGVHVERKGMVLLVR